MCRLDDHIAFRDDGSICSRYVQSLIEEFTWKKATSLANPHEYVIREHNPIYVCDIDFVMLWVLENFRKEKYKQSIYKVADLGVYTYWGMGGDYRILNRKCIIAKK